MQIEGITTRTCRSGIRMKAQSWVVLVLASFLLLQLWLLLRRTASSVEDYTKFPPPEWLTGYGTGQSSFPNVILVLAGGVDRQGRVHPFVAQRLQAAAQVALAARAAGVTIPVICNGL